MPAPRSMSLPSAPSGPTVDSRLRGVDFTSAPSRRKPITVADGHWEAAGGGDGVLCLDALRTCPQWADFESVLAEPGPWLGAFDFPFGLPRVFVDDLGLGVQAVKVSDALHRRCPDRMALRALIDAWGNARPAGQRLPHRRTDRSLGTLGSTSPLQTRYVPVGFMYFEGLSRLLAAGVTLPGLAAGDPARVALEGYPGALAHALIGRRSYKNDDRPDRLIARMDMVEALSLGRVAGVPRLRLRAAQRDALLADAGGDRLDAVLCLAQAAWAARQPRWGLPPEVDPVEGWIVGPRP